MPTLQFPNTPVLNDTYTAGGKTWTYNGSVWVRNGVLRVGTAAYAAALTLDVTSTDHIRVGALTGNVTALNLTGGVAGQRIVCFLPQDATGGRTVTLGTSIALSADLPSYTASVAGNNVDLLSFIYDGVSGKYLLTAVNKGFTLPVVAFSPAIYLGCNGANLSTAITNSGVGPVAIAQGSAALSTTNVKYGSSSLKLNGATTGVVKIPYDSATWGGLDLQDPNWTIECWAYLTAATPDYTRLLSFSGGLGIAWPQAHIVVHRDAGVLHAVFGVSSANNGMTIGADYQPAGFFGEVALNTWNHFAVCRIAGTSYKCFVNGVLGNTFTTTDKPYTPRIGGITIGGGYDYTWGGAGNIAVTTPDGYMDDIAVTIGVARYTNAFTPAVYPLA